ncbi:hypothetical protein QBC32DRAFT_365294 [Pseudoneurospora amorphoporcata]|uniref:Uncharacterized protein n=1 Tax=Pseudoneurospora amorphoporcata TaxID=241081 RepID=A0AAN6NNG4_9PEZI|nr:hypothetical protein QBC32DRAFT_365294 [Pseudoneurospora amorphoporcata]
MSFTSSAFRFLSLPPEIRLSVYRALWLVPIRFSHEQHQEEAKQPIQASHQLQLVTTFKNLAGSCRQIRDELWYEFATRVLPRTQIHLGSAYETPTPSPAALTNHRIFKELQSSAYFAQNLQHVSLHCSGCDDGRARYRPQIKPWACLKWLTTLPNLRTMEVVFTDPLYLPVKQLTTAPIAPPPPSAPGPVVVEEAAAEEVPEEVPEDERGPEYDDESDEEWGPEWGSPEDQQGPNVFDAFFCPDCWETFTVLPESLEKVVFRVWCPENPEDEDHPDAADEMWEVTEYFHRTRIEEAAASRSGCWRRFRGAVVDDSAKPREYEFPYHVGAIDVEWPLSERL